MIPIIFDMETSDPDDALTLCLLAGHPEVNLVGVTVTPGSRQQMGVVAELLKRLDKGHVPYAARDIDYPKECVSEFHYKWLGKIEPGGSPMRACDLIENILSWQPDTKIITGAALTNIKNLLNENPHVKIQEMLIQGGFAGDSVVAPEHRLAKFAGKETCPTFNLNGDIEAAKLVLSDPRVALRHFVSKNICHGVVYDMPMHERMKTKRNNNIGIQMIVEGMEVYLRKNKDGKKFHDPLAACALIDKSVCEFKEVELYREKGEWGSRLKSGTNTFISVSVDRNRFETVLAGEK